MCTTPRAAGAAAASASRRRGRSRPTYTAEQEKRWAEALSLLEAYRAALRIDPDLAEAHLNVAAAAGSDRWKSVAAYSKKNVKRYAPLQLPAPSSCSPPPWFARHPAWRGEGWGRQGEAGGVVFCFKLKVV